MKKTTLSLYWFFTALVIIGLGACRSLQPENKYNGEPPDFHTTRLMVNWPGEYTGIIPAADGRLLKVYLNLFCDNAYELTYFYLDKPDTPLLAMGKFEWDKSEGYITLNVKDFPPYYKVASRRLIQTDRKGKIMTNDQGDICLMKTLEHD